MKIDDLIAQLEHWKSQGYIYARKEGKNWHLSSNQDFPDPYTQEYWQSIVHPDADWDNEDDWKEGKDFVNVKCLIEDLTIWGPNERSDGYLKIEVDGDQDQSIEGVPYATIYEESESTQTSGYLKIGYRF